MLWVKQKATKVWNTSIGIDQNRFYKKYIKCTSAPNDQKETKSEPDNITNYANKIH